MCTALCSQHHINQINTICSFTVRHCMQWTQNTKKMVQQDFQSQAQGKTNMQSMKDLYF